MQTVIDGKELASDILAGVREEVLHFKKNPELVAIIIGSDPASLSYLDAKRKKCEEVGIGYVLYQYDEKITTTQLRKKISDVRKKRKHTSIIIELPLPGHINTQYILDSIPPEKDPDMLSSRSWGLLATGKSAIFPPTAAAVIHILETSNVELERSHVVLVGWGGLVGKPLSLILTKRVSSLTVIRSKTPDISHFTREADILITGAGKPNLITGDMVKEGVVALDAGYSRMDGKVVGDLDFDSVSKKASTITPVPGGIGPLTVALLLKNVLTLARDH